jgi:AcrR family transcriptional regulator
MTRGDIIQAAFRAWGRSCYRSTSLSEVAGELGVSKAALYRHFANKQALLEAMYEWFLDDYSAEVREGFRRAAAAAPPEAIRVLVRVIMEYYARNAQVFMFALVYVYGARRLGDHQELLEKRGLPLGVYDAIQRFAPDSLSTHLILATLIFTMAHFHRLRPAGGPEGENFAAGGIERGISLVLCIVSGGLGFQKQEIEALDYGALEKRVSGIKRSLEENDLLHSVAEAVAGAGPWDVSMEMVARLSGLSKSGLYAHFTNKRDMLLQLFVTEFDRIIDFAEESLRGSRDPAEKLYLAIFAICDYLRSRPDVLIALDWLRTRRIDLSPETGDRRVPSRLYRIFQYTPCSAELARRLSGPEDDWIPAWILFLLVASLMQSVWTDAESFMAWLNMPEGSRRRVFREKLAEVPNETIRNLYRFITAGTGDSGFPPREAEAVYEYGAEEPVRP